MDKIDVNSVGKSFYRSWLFKDINLQFDLNPGDAYAILGNNGSGKSTFLLMLAGQVTPTIGRIDWRINGSTILDHRKHLSYALSSPLMELPEELNLQEWFEFIQKVKPLLPSVSLEYIADICKFTKKTLSKPLANYSSGMKQRVKLCGNLLSDTKVSFLDEPLSNLDNNGAELYQNLVNEALVRKTLFVASNDPKEYNFVRIKFEIQDKQIIQLV